MLEAILNSPFTTTVTGVGTLSDVVVYKDGALSGLTPVVVQIGTSTAWSVSFTPTSTGVYSVYAFGVIQYRVKAVTKSLYDFLKNVEDEALGSWSWNKSTGVLTVLRQDGTTLATHTALDSLTAASRERVS